MDTQTLAPKHIDHLNGFGPGLVPSLEKVHAFPINRRPKKRTASFKSLLSNSIESGQSGTLLVLKKTSRTQQDPLPVYSPPYSQSRDRLEGLSGHWFATRLLTCRKDRFAQWVLRPMLGGSPEWQELRSLTCKDAWPSVRERSRLVEDDVGDPLSRFQCRASAD